MSLGTVVTQVIGAVVDVEFPGVIMCLKVNDALNR